MTQTIILTEGTDDSRKCDVSKHFPAYILIREYNNNNNNNVIVHQVGHLLRQLRHVSVLQLHHHQVSTNNCAPR